MRRSMWMGGLLLASSALLTSTSAGYADVTYLVTGVFNDGTTLSGDFVIDAYGYLSGWNLTTQDGLISGYDYTPSTTVLGGCGANCLNFGRNDPAYYGGLQLTFTTPLGSYGPVAVDTNPSASWENLSWTAGGEPLRYFVNNSDIVVTGVPEASTWAMLLVGFAGLGLAGYRASRKGGAVAALQSIKS
jgi:hypothetical protein